MVRPACKCQLQASGTRQITDHASVHKRHSAHDPRTADERRVPRRQPFSLTREQSVSPVQKGRRCTYSNFDWLGYFPGGLNYETHGRQGREGPRSNGLAVNSYTREIGKRNPQRGSLVPT